MKGRKHLAPPACRVVWRLPQALVPRTLCFGARACRRSHLTCLLSPPDGVQRDRGVARRGAAGRLARIRPGRASQHPQRGSDTCLQSRLNKSLLFAKRRPEELTLFICYHLVSATGESFAHLFLGAGWFLGGAGGHLQAGAWVPTSGDGLALRSSRALDVPASGDCSPECGVL